MKILTMILLVFSGSLALASDYWDNCSDATGAVSMEMGSLFIDGIGETTNFKLKKLSIVKTERETCVLKDSKPPVTVVSLDNTTTVEEVTYTLEENDKPSTVILICERGGSGVPAAYTCK